MAEGFLKKFGQDRFKVYSAGLNPGKINPQAIEVMKEKGIDISAHTSNDIMSYIGKVFFQYVIIVCGHSDKACPNAFPGVEKRMFWSFEDPAVFEGSEEEIKNKFCQVRDLIEAKINGWVKEIS